MIKSSLIAIALCLCIFNAHAQSFNAITVQQDTPSVNSDNNLTPNTEKKDSVTTDKTISENSPSEQNDFSEEMAARGIKTLPPEEVDKMRDDLRDNLRKTTKFDDMKEKIDYLEVNNRLDKTFYRRKLQTMGEDYDTSSKIASRKRKLQINPQNDTQMEELVLERAGVPENTKQQ